MKAYGNYKRLLKIFFVSFYTEKLERKGIKNSIKKKNFKYLEKIKNIINEEENIFEFELKDLIKNFFPKELKWLFLSNTKRFLNIMRDAIDDIIEEVYPTVSFFLKKKLINKIQKSKNEKADEILNGKTSKILNFFQIIIKPLFNEYSDSISLLGANFIGKFIILTGYVVDFCPVKILAKKIFFVCSFCNTKISQNSNYEHFKPYIRCPKKKCNKEKSTDNLYLDTNLTNFEEFQEIKISQKFGEESIDSPLPTIKIKLFGNLVKPFKIGQRIKIGGILLPDHSFEKNYQNHIENVYVEALFIEKNMTLFAAQNDSSIIEKKIINMCKHENIYKTISNSIAPFVYGNTDLKKGFLLSLIGNQTLNPSYFSNFRENINICIIGDSNTSKTKILRYIAQLTPQGIYKNAKESLKFDLFFSQNKHKKMHQNTQNEFRTLFSDANIVCLDEIDRLKEKNIKFLYKILKYNSNIFPITNSINFYNEKNSTIIASSALEKNLSETKDSYWNENKRIEFFFQFDLIFLLSNYMGNSFEVNLAKHILYSHQFSSSCFFSKHNLIDKKILKSFILEAQKGIPYIHRDLANFIIYNYVIWKGCEKEFPRNQVSIRTIFTVIRLSFSLARLKFQKLVSRFDIKEAIRLIISSKKSYLNMPSNFRRDSMESSEYQIYFLIRNYSIKHRKTNLTLGYIEKFITEKGFTREKFVSCLRYFEELKIWTISVVQGELVFIN
ncbi:minichromosome maintenance component complex 7-like protein (nucleomorph) [Chroomonas mesostigmatica CCMP1168]|uniref:DNA helicase n=1 Tax=Chroomonas mesostigmatica CCMP1168 TaxID=1195612 RepID=J7GAE1_9CRYP|nr:minichromosome maintenance component complex 7-like protein [Chroomonas mesostigmatica CCMP1168]|mmetsp:Transcript_289/g.780  ORF Transcript_289/g.780 Transcript_289/m.780 type:complete len:725 (-) Transcript_289:759-2933(-)